MRKIIEFIFDNLAAHREYHKIRKLTWARHPVFWMEVVDKGEVTRLIPVCLSDKLIHRMDGVR